ncbi:MAG: tetratricopeptide repeat protein [Candidatus Aminicenantia bacterium]
MRKITLFFLLLFFIISSLVFPSDKKGSAEKNLKFGIVASQRGLWKEAIFRWKKVIELDPTNWKAYNNLAVAYEREGMFKEALNLYESALQYSRDNPYVKKNYTACLAIIEKVMKEK